MAPSNKEAELRKMGLTEHELTLGTAAWLATKEPCQIDWQEFANLAGYANTNSAQSSFATTKRKLRRLLDTARAGRPREQVPGRRSSSDNSSGGSGGSKSKGRGGRKPRPGSAGQKSQASAGRHARAGPTASAQDDDADDEEEAVEERPKKRVKADPSAAASRLGDIPMAKTQKSKPNAAPVKAEKARVKSEANSNAGPARATRSLDQIPLFQGGGHAQVKKAPTEEERGGGQADGEEDEDDNLF